MKGLLLPLFFLTIFSLSAQRPKIGLVLSGGGAKGMAHIGALKVIDSLGIPIDYVAGTSMGSVVGGFYALGYSAKEIEHAFVTADWDDILSDASPRKYVNYNLKNRHNRYLFNTYLKGTSVVVPSGVINGQKMLNLLNFYSQGYHGDLNFMEDLPRKFLCIAANLNTGEEKVFTEGSIPDAIRASVSIPSVFSPHRIDGTLYVDGGTMNNFPSDQLKKLGCDIIIGLNVQSPYKDTLEEVSLIEVLNLMGSFMDNQTFQERQENCQYLIHSDVSPYSLMDFNSGPAIIKTGKVAAMAQIDTLVDLARQLEKYNYPNVEEYAHQDSVFIDSIFINDLKRSNTEFWLKKLEVKERELTAISDIEEQIKYLYGTGKFKGVGYKLLFQEGGNAHLQIFAEENITDTHFGVNLHFDTDFSAALGLSIYKDNAILKSASFGFDLLIREDYFAKLSYDMNNGSGPGFHLESRLYKASPNYYEDHAYQGEMILHDWSNRAFFQTNFTHEIAFMVGPQLDLQYFNFDRIPAWAEKHPDLAGQTLQTTHFVINAEVAMDNRDHRDFPTSGRYFSFVFQVIENLHDSYDIRKPEPFSITSLDYTEAFSVGRFTFKPRARAGFTFGHESSFAYRFFTGSFGHNHINFNRPFPGYRFMEYRVKEETYNDIDSTYSEYKYLQNVTSLELDIRFQLFKSHFVTAFGGIGSGSYLSSNMFTSYFSGYGFRYEIRSALGPIGLTLHTSPEHNLWFGYFNLGFWLM